MSVKGSMLKLLLQMACIVVVLLINICSLEALESTSLRCAGRLIHVGDSKRMVEDICGPPHYVDVAREQIVVKSYRKHSKQEHRHLDHESAVEREHREDVVIEEWTYNFGRSRFIQILQFENDRLFAIRSGGYGYDKDVTHGPHLAIGDTMAIVMMKYGKPTDIVKIPMETTWDRYNNGEKYLHAKSVRQKYDQQQWLYDFGPNRFQERLTFTKNRLEKIETLKQRGTKK